MMWTLLMLLSLYGCADDGPCKCGYGRAEDGLCYPVQDPDGSAACPGTDTADTGA